MASTKINAFTRKVHLFQILAYVFFTGDFLLYYFVVFPLSNDIAKYIGIVLETILGFGVIYYGYRASVIDPSDPMLIKHKEAKSKGEEYEFPEKDFYCNIDECYVLESSKHCKRCNRCVENFDHHCKWINNCVGKANYKEFFRLISILLVYLIIYIVQVIAITVQFSNDETLADNNILLFDEDESSIIKGLIPLWIFSSISALFILLDGNLVIFHIYLMDKKLTTFEYILVQQDRKEARNLKKKEEAEKKLGGKKKTWMDAILCLGSKKPKRVIQQKEGAGDAKDNNNNNNNQTDGKDDINKKETNDIISGNGNEVQALGFNDHLTPVGRPSNEEKYKKAEIVDQNGESPSKQEAETHRINIQSTRTEIQSNKAHQQDPSENRGLKRDESNHSEHVSKNTVLNTKMASAAESMKKERAKPSDQQYPVDVTNNDDVSVELTEPQEGGDRNQSRTFNNKSIEQLKLNSNIQGSQLKHENNNHDAKKNNLLQSLETGRSQINENQEFEMQNQNSENDRKTPNTMEKKSGRV